MKLLINYGANLYAVNGKNMTALELSERVHWKKGIDILYKSISCEKAITCCVKFLNSRVGKDVSRMICKMVWKTKYDEVWE